MSISVIVSTYNSPAWLEKVIWGFQNQSFKNFEMIVADDGSTEDTGKLVERMKGESEFPIRHIWQEHKGFGKCSILNKAISSCDAEYIVMTDGDCIPRADFLYAHASLRRAGRFIAGDCCKLPMETSKAIGKEDIATQLAFEPDWLREHGMKHIPMRLRTGGGLAKFFDLISAKKVTWDGHNSSAWKRDLLAVNGFDETMGYGGLNRELGERLINLGIRPLQARHYTICIHLEHSRDYKSAEALTKNHVIRRETHKTGRSWTENGIVKGPAEKI
jgi:glycosyltransferase involved in cell wall biosynthesis